MRKVPFFLYGFQEGDLKGIADVIAEHSSFGKERGIAFDQVPNYVEILEKQASEITKAPHTIAVSSQISATLLALQALEIKRNHRVICSVYCHPFVPECIRYFDAEPVFVDVDPTTLAMLPEKCEELLLKKDKERIKAMIVSHIGGTPTEMDPFYDLKEKYKVGLIEEASFAVGMKYKDGNYVGSNPRSDFTIVSHFLGGKEKLFNAGMLLTNNEEKAKKCISLRYHSKERGSNNYGLFYDIVDMSLDHTMSMLSARMAHYLAERLEMHRERRSEIAKMYREGLKGISGLTLPVENKDDVHTLFIVRLKKSRDRISSLLYEAGIETSLHFIPINLLSYYKNKFQLKVMQFPNAFQAYQEVLSLPLYAGMSNEDVQYVIDTLKEILAQELE